MLPASIEELKDYRAFTVYGELNMPGNVNFMLCAIPNKTRGVTELRWNNILKVLRLALKHLDNNHGHWYTYGENLTDLDVTYRNDMAKAAPDAKVWLVWIDGKWESNYPSIIQGE